MRYRVLIALALVAAAVVGPAGAAHAQCGPTLEVEDSLVRAEVVFVGTVVDRSNRDRTAIMDVHEVWKGTRLPASVTVNGGPEDISQFTSVDRSWLLGQTYLVMPANDRSPFQDSLCSGTQLWSTPTGEIPENFQLAVGNISPIPLLIGAGSAGGDDGLSGSFGNVGVAVAVLAVALGLIWLVRKLGSRRKPGPTRPHSPRPDGALPTAALRSQRRMLPGFSMSAMFESKRGSRLEQVRKATRRRRRGPGEQERQQLERAVKLTATKPPSRRNHYTSGRRSAP